MRRSLCLCCVALAMAPSADITASSPGETTELVLDERVLMRHGALTVWAGGFGSAMATHPTRAGLFYFLSDRGPNADTGRPDEKVFLRPSHAPRIGLFRREGARLRRVREILLRDASGRPLSGLPNPPGAGGTGERAVDTRGRELPPDPRGVDPEGLVALADGTFWVAEEYGPSLLHLDANGRTLERIDPYTPSARGRRLPRVLASRRPNYGFEGLTVTPDGKTLVAVLQSPLDNPSRDVRRTARVTRLVSMDVETGRTRQFAYVHDAPGLFNTEVLALSDRELLVLERDVLFPGHPEKPARHKRVYRAELEGATDLSDPDDSPRGRVFGGRTPEELEESEMTAAGLRPVARTLAVDLLALPGGYPHDKPEGMALLAPDLLAVCNDDDFGITDDDGALVVKRLPGAAGARDRNRVRLMPLPRR
jgi:hypothetical protein